MKKIEQLLSDYAGELYYWYGELHDSFSDTIYPDADDLIAEYFDNWPIVIEHPSKDPQREEEVVVDGKTYIQACFNGDYEKALAFIRRELRLK